MTKIRINRKENDILHNYHKLLRQMNWKLNLYLHYMSNIFLNEAISERTSNFKEKK